MLIAQNFVFTLVSRARNSKSLAFHALASIPSNGVWVASQFILVGEAYKITQTQDIKKAILVGTFYTFFTMLGSISSHYVSMNYLEKKIK